MDKAPFSVRAGPGMALSIQTLTLPGRSDMVGLTLLKTEVSFTLCTCPQFTRLSCGRYGSLGSVTSRWLGKVSAPSRDLSGWNDAAPDRAAEIEPSGSLVGRNLSWRPSFPRADHPRVSVVCARFLCSLLFFLPSQNTKVEPTVVWLLFQAPHTEPDGLYSLCSFFFSPYRLPCVALPSLHANYVPSTEQSI